MSATARILLPMYRKTVLCVDDQPSILALMARILKGHFQVETAPDGATALRHLQEFGPCAVVLSDMDMPGMSGLELLQEVERAWPDTVRIMITGNADQSTAADAVNRGHVFRFLPKPASASTLLAMCQAGMKQHELIVAERDVLERTLNGSVAVLTDILALLDPTAFGLGQRMRACVRQLAQPLGITQTWDLELAALLFPIGLVTLPPRVIDRMQNQFVLTTNERDMLDRVPRTGANLLAKIPRLEGVAETILYQNKNFDGTGFPVDPCKGAAIPHGARVLRIIKDLIELEARGLARPKALEKMRAATGVYDPELLAGVSQCFPAPVSETALAAVAVRTEIPLRDLVSGQLLVEDIRTTGGMVIVPRSTVVTPALLEKLHNFAELEGVQQPLVIGVMADGKPAPSSRGR